METVICIPQRTGATENAGRCLSRRGITATSLPGADVTHLLLPVPSFESDGSLRGGGSIEPLLRQLPREVCIIGGNLNHPTLEGYETIDLLRDPQYLAQNAAITAHCALKRMLNQLPVTLDRQPVLVIGWGRIGKCLARLLRQLDARVTILARKETDRAMAAALGFSTMEADGDVSRFRVLVNTAPAQVLREAQISRCRPDCLKLDLASSRGLPGADVIHARGLPGKDAPETSGRLIADSVMQFLYHKEAAP